MLDGQYGQPKGLVGRWLGQRMVRQHIPETDWTISLLNLAAQDQVLELGFGAGRAIELVATRLSTGQVSGVDISRAMVRAAAHRNARTIKSGKVLLKQEDLTHLSFNSDKFDKVFTIQTLYFWPDLQMALAEIYRVLKPGGCLVITLSTGTIDGTGLTHYQQLIDQKVLPVMRHLGFTEAYTREGPLSRQFKTTAVIGIK